MFKVTHYSYVTLEVFYPDMEDISSGHILFDYIHNFKAYPKYLGFNLGEDITVCRGEETTLEVQLPPSQKNYPFKWSTGETSTKIIVKEPGIYWAELKSTCGVFRDSIEIKHEKCIFIPNAFTPNQDGKNETFYIKGINKGNWQLKIYDRRGKLVYESNAYKNDWKGDNLPTSLYYYRLTNEENGEDYKGWVQIMK
jgi:gliding motility-associated-like protein